MNIGLGFDTGGTYTDAVLLDLDTNAVIQKAKSLTTRQNLVIGIKDALSDFDRDLISEISIVSLSSTLATNSIVEGKGCRVGLVCIGRESDGSIPVNEYACISGGCSIKGNETHPLDEVALSEFLERIRGKVDCVAISGYLSVRNPDHENRAEEMVKSLLDLPTVCSHHLSSNLGFDERTITSVMNARLIPVIKDLISSVESVMSDFGISAPLMIVKGDGSVMSVEMAVSRPIETILSGPAASLTGARRMTGRGDAIIVDIGGTTTDIGILRNGFPILKNEGAMIGGKRTHVRAAEISTSGIGGDSRVVATKYGPVLTPLRVVPLCIASCKWPEIGYRLKELSEKPGRSIFESSNNDDMIQDIEFFIASKPPTTESLTQADRSLLDRISEGPLSLSEAGAELNLHPLMFNISRMEEYGLIQRIGFTPTDILHAEGTYTQYDREASASGVAYLSKRLRMDPDVFIRTVKTMVIEKIAMEILEKLTYEETGSLHLCTICRDLLQKMITGAEGLDYGISIKLNKPIIGIGAPVGVWLPEVASRLGSELIIPENSDVGNAIGAVTGYISESTEIRIDPTGARSESGRACSVFSRFGMFRFDDMQAGMDFAEEEGGRFVADIVRASGAEDVSITKSVRERRYDVDGQTVVMDVTVIMTAIGKPRQLSDAGSHPEPE